MSLEGYWTMSIGRIFNAEAQRTQRFAEILGGHQPGRIFLTAVLCAALRLCV
jgi:hypothetical protein